MEQELLTGEVRSEDESPDFSVYTDMSRRLLIELWDSRTKTISKEDIKEDVIGDSFANDSYVWTIVSKTNTEMLDKKFPFKIVNIRGVGYKLVPTRTLTNPYKKQK
jgi:DNA-binding response OmpR family regulator